MVRSRNDENYLEDCGILQDYEQGYGTFDSNINIAVDRSQILSIWICLKASLECTVFCGLLVGLFGTILWWLELNIGTYCFTDWNNIPESIHRTRLIADVIIAFISEFWAFSCIAPLCGWSIIKELNLVYISTIGALVDALLRVLLYIFAYYSHLWRHYIASLIFLVTSFTICFQYARHFKATRNVLCNVCVLAVKLNLQFIFGLLFSIPFNLVFLDLYYNSSSIVKTILACILIVAFAIPKLFISHVVTNLHGIRSTDDAIVLVIAYMTSATIITRLMQAKIENLPYFIVISLVHGLLNVFDKLSSPLRRRILSCMFSNCTQKRSHQLTPEIRPLILANQTLISIITETTSVIFSNAAAYLLVYYYKRKEVTGEKYNGYLLLKEMAIRCSIAVGIELIFNVLAVKIQTHLYKIPVISVWKKKWKSIIIIHMVQVLFIVLHFSEYLNDNILLRDYYKKGNATCFGFFERV